MLIDQQLGVWTDMARQADRRRRASSSFFWPLEWTRTDCIAVAFTLGDPDLLAGLGYTEDLAVEHLSHVLGVDKRAARDAFWRVYVEACCAGGAS